MLNRSFPPVAIAGFQHSVLKRLMRLWFTNFSSTDYRLFTRETTLAFAYLHTFSSTPRYEHHPFQPLILKITFAFHPSSFLAAKEMRLNVKAYITVFPLVTSHLIQLIALFSHFSWFFSSFCFLSNPRKPFFLLIISPSRPRGKRNLSCQQPEQGIKNLSSSCSYTLLSCFTLINK